MRREKVHMISERGALWSRVQKREREAKEIWKEIREVEEKIGNSCEENIQILSGVSISPPPPLLACEGPSVLERGGAGMQYNQSLTRLVEFGLTNSSGEVDGTGGGTATRAGRVPEGMRRTGEAADRKRQSQNVSDSLFGQAVQAAWRRVVNTHPASPSPSPSPASAVVPRMASMGVLEGGGETKRKQTIQRGGGGASGFLHRVMSGIGFDLPGFLPASGGTEEGGEGGPGRGGGAGGSSDNRMESRGMPRGGPNPGEVQAAQRAYERFFGRPLDATTPVPVPPMPVRGARLTMKSDSDLRLEAGGVGAPSNMITTLSSSPGPPKAPSSMWPGVLSSADTEGVLEDSGELTARNRQAVPRIKAPPRPGAALRGLKHSESTPL
uniref:Uncharacterized protein n=1 Tax=Chromera velia CCMP2878 TaxID=1169474 RepID=A0A0G4FRG1_9ALVE|eukprot:Cvel_18280.t1-p1 / transcript=Cvel_18280.t1 / gene=Cvel_18280 / organism=Chromera_velia_CCMP2878 / gene_product=hypothetical protein / transcript_product=hypothetical protein / location=Cvel_scaffold1506:12263-15566(+) / protein_length=381 / sequence_SO=supercontig / SO=protein_coding / is_pseudo=false